jgi:hypothetical protein
VPKTQLEPGMNPLRAAIVRALGGSTTKTKEESIRPMTTMEKWNMAAQQAYESTSPLKRLNQIPDVGPGIGVIKAARTLTLADKARLEELFKVPLKAGKRPRIVEDEIASLLQIPSRYELNLMMKNKKIFGY